MDQEAGQFVAFVTMEEAVTEGLAQAAEVVKDDLSGGVEFVQPCVEEVAAKVPGEISMRLETRNDHRSFRMQCSKRMSKTVERRMGKGEREVKQDAFDRVAHEWSGRIPVGSEPSHLNQSGGRDGIGKCGGQLTNEGAHVSFGYNQGFMGLAKPDVAKGTGRWSALMCQPVGLICQHYPSEVALAAAHVEDRHARFKRKELSIELVLQCPVGG
jgi:hypothetical protein